MQKFDQLVDRFGIIDKERMQGLPFYNNQLSIEAVDFQKTTQGLIGALVTPWFINIILLYTEQPKESIPLGSKVNHNLPSGEHAFMVGEDEVLGRYDFISLASPPGKFKSQQHACDFARQQLHKIMSAGQEHLEERPVQFIHAEGKKLTRREFLRRR